MSSTDDGKRTIPRWRITYYDEEREPDIVVVGAWEITLAERKHYVGAVDQGSTDAILYAAFHGAKRAGLVSKSADFDNWAREVARVDEVPAGESREPLES